MRRAREAMAGITLAAGLVAPAFAASTLRVPADHATIGQAIAFAQDGDTVLVSPGIYPEQVDFMGRDIVVRSTDGPEATIIDGQGQYTVVLFVNGEPPSARLEGFTVRNGLGLQPGEAGGIWCDESDPTIADCIVTGNQGAYAPVTDFDWGGGGGIGGSYSEMTIERCVVESNVGGGHFNGNAGAGGIDLVRSGLPGPTSGAVVRECVIRQNVGGGTTESGHAGPGGFRAHISVVELKDCLVQENVGGHAALIGKSGTGGGASIWSALQIKSSRIFDNLGGANLLGNGDGGPGGLRFQARLTTAPTLPQSITNTVIAWNHGGPGAERATGGVLLSDAWIDITNCALVGNVGTGVDATGGLATRSLDTVFPIGTVSNTIFWLNEGQGDYADDIQVLSNDPPVVSNALMGTDPLFVDLASNDFHIGCLSPAINAGTDTAPVLPLTDFDGEPRISGAQVDIGPDEFPDPPVFPTYCQATQNSSGLEASITGQGCLSISRNEMQVAVDGLPDTPGLLFYGPNQIQASFGDGFRCVGGAVRRLPPMPGMGSSIVIDLDLPSLLITPGIQSNFQYWFRDPMAGGAGFNLSNAVVANFVP